MFFSTSIFVQNCQFWGKKIEILWEILTFSNNCSECEYLIGKYAYFQKILTFCVIVYIHQETRILIKNLIFLRKCLFVHVLIFIRVFLLLENCYFDSKYDFIRWHFGQKYHFSNKYSLFLKTVRFWWRYFSLVKNIILCQRSEFLCTVIKSSRAKLWG